MLTQVWLINQLGLEIIETYWNVNSKHEYGLSNRDFRNNRNILECK